MLSTTTTTITPPSPRVRRTPQISAQRRARPYLDYNSPTTSKRASTNAPGALPEQKGWTGPRGYGARHPLDDAPFTLWDQEKSDFRAALKSESAWILDRFSATGIAFQFPVIVVETEHPPNPLPLTIAGAAVQFVSPPAKEERLEDGSRARPIQDARPLKFTNDYTAVKGVPDPLNFALRKWLKPTDDEIQKLLGTFFSFCNPRRVYILCPWLFVELRTDDGYTYKPMSLPNRVGGYAVRYHHQADSLFKGLATLGRERQIKPIDSIKDNYDYLSEWHRLCPGICVSSGRLDRAGVATSSYSTTAGVLLRNNHGQQRLTVSDHGFLKSDEVFHPTNSAAQIGEIDERWKSLDVALVKLNPSVNFSNGNYFEAQEPKRLLRGSEIPEGAFFSVDGMSTGCHYYQFQGLVYDEPRRTAGMTRIESGQFYIYRSFGPSSAAAIDGICGAPFVETDTDDGGVACFFQSANEDWAANPALDELIDGSWSVV